MLRKIKIANLESIPIKTYFKNEDELVILLQIHRLERSTAVQPREKKWGKPYQIEAAVTPKSEEDTGNSNCGITPWNPHGEKTVCCSRTATQDHAYTEKI